MARTYTTQIFQQLLLFLFFFLQNIVLYPLLNLEEPPPPQPKRKHRMWVKPWIMHRDDKGAYTNIMADLYETDQPGFKNYLRMTPDFFEMLKERLVPRLTRGLAAAGD